MNNRVHGVVSARLILALASGVAHFNQLQREALTRNPNTTSRLLKALVRGGYAVREMLGDGGNPLFTRWTLTEAGRQQVEAARSTLLSAVATREARAAERDTPSDLPPVVLEADRADRRLLNCWIHVSDRVNTGRREPL